VTTIFVVVYNRKGCRFWSLAFGFFDLCVGLLCSTHYLFRQKRIAERVRADSNFIYEPNLEIDVWFVDLL